MTQLCQRMWFYFYQCAQALPFVYLTLRHKRLKAEAVIFGITDTSLARDFHPEMCGCVRSFARHSSVKLFELDLPLLIDALVLRSAPGFVLASFL